MSFSSADATVHPAEANGQSAAAAAAAAEEEIEDWRWRKLAKAPVLPRWGHTLTRVVRPSRPGLCHAQTLCAAELLTCCLVLQAEGQVFVLGGENSEECFDSGHIYKHTAGQGWSFEEVAARQGPFGHRTW